MKNNILGYSLSSQICKELSKIPNRCLLNSQIKNSIDEGIGKLYFSLRKNLFERVSKGIRYEK